MGHSLGYSLDGPLRLSSQTTCADIRRKLQDPSAIDEAWHLIAQRHRMVRIVKLEGPQPPSEWDTAAALLAECEGPIREKMTSQYARPQLAYRTRRTP